MTVYLVGAGPGDPGLLTVRGAEILRRADVVVYDRLSVASLLELAPAGAERISVGKAPGRVTLEQAEIDALLVERGRTGATVVRLKGGDPFVFARGGEEAAALRAAGVDFEIVPGVTSAVAVPAYAGVPITHRGLSTSFTVVTGHEDPWAATETDWEAVARVGGTVVVLMGVATRAAIAQRLLAGGLPPSTPVAAVTWGTRPAQRAVRTTLGELGATPVDSPAVLVIGAVAGLDLAWFERRPLFGRTVVVTRAASQSSRLVAYLRDLGAEAIALPVIAVADAADGGDALRRAAGRAGDFDWIAFTSANGVERFFEYVRDARALGAARVAAVGPGTAAALRERGVTADLVPERSLAEGLVADFASGPGRVLAPLAEGAAPTLADGLRERGWEVDVVVAYRTVTVSPDPEAVAAARSADAVILTSSSTVDGYVAAVGLDGVAPVVACIGPVTAARARRAGLSVSVVPEAHTVEGVVAALTRTMEGA